MPPCTPDTYQFTPVLLVPETVAANVCDWPPPTVAAVGEITMPIEIGSGLETGAPTDPLFDPPLELPLEPPLDPLLELLLDPLLELPLDPLLEPEDPLLDDVVLPVLVPALVLELPLFVAPAVVVPLSVAELPVEEPPVGVTLLAAAAVNDSEPAVEKLRLAGALHAARKPIQTNKVMPRKFFSESCPRAPGLVSHATTGFIERF